MATRAAAASPPGAWTSAAPPATSVCRSWSRTCAQSARKVRGCCLIGWLWQPSSRPHNLPCPAPCLPPLHSPSHPPCLSPPPNLPKSCRRRRLLHPCVPRHHRHVAPPPGHPVGVERLLLQHRGRHPPGAQGGWRGGRGGAGLRDSLPASPCLATHRLAPLHNTTCAALCRTASTPSGRPSTSPTPSTRSSR